LQPIRLRSRLTLRCVSTLLVLELVYSMASPRLTAQVSPAEVLNPDLKALEHTYLAQLTSLNESIAKLKFPFSFYLSRYVEIDPSRQAGADSRGLEFVRFQERVLLKITGIYGAAYNTARLTQNERAADTFRAVVIPVLKLVTSALPQEIACTGIGFEIGYHTRGRSSSYDFEGKETLVVVLGRDAAWALSAAATDAQRQEILNRSQIFVSGADFGLSLTERDPLNVQSLTRSVPPKPDATSTAHSTVAAGHSALLKAVNSSAPSPPSIPALVDSAPEANKYGTTGVTNRPEPAPLNSPSSRGGTDAPAAAAKVGDAVSEETAPTQAEADRLTEKHHSQLAEFGKVGIAKFHFIDYAPPAFTVFHKQMTFQMTMRNSLQFGVMNSSIYKRAAQTFDLFLAPLLKDLSDEVPADMEFQVFDFSVLNKLGADSKTSSEAIEYICPRAALHQFVEADITNQQLLDQSAVLVNGVRIALNLQLVE
jgi:hypothetical protein